MKEGESSDFEKVDWIESKIETKWTITGFEQAEPIKSRRIKLG